MGSAIATRKLEAAGERERPSFQARRRRFSALTLRILAPNVLALAVLVGGVLYLDRYKDGLIQARLEGLASQANLIAGALAEAAVGGGEEPSIFDQPAMETIIRRLAFSTQTRIRVFDSRGILVSDSRALIGAGRAVEQSLLVPPDYPVSWLERAERWFDTLMPRFDTRGYRPYRERVDQQAGDYPEVLEALIGNEERALRRLADGKLHLSVAVPVQRLRQVHGGLMITAVGDDIEDAVNAARIGVLQAFLLALCVTVLLSVFLAGTIARPLRRLAHAAEQVRGRLTRPARIPDLSHRRDEIGDLSLALNEMTQALQGRIDGIAGFAADVAHEIKNPLTSLRSALETFGATADEEKRKRLLGVMQLDIRRLDRLITDISNASRLDAELAREDPEPVDIAELLRTLVEVYQTAGERTVPGIRLDLPRDRLMVSGAPDRLGQVVRNLVDNAISFSPPGGHIRIGAGRRGPNVQVIVEDEGPGIPEDKLGAVFDRFYSARPEAEAFGNHSGLGLSIARQIAEAHRGNIVAENRAQGGARFVVTLPAG
jgi:two-component system, OmpR family, sensor histidine kinase ChvG